MSAVKERVAELLLEELKNGVMEWYYISVADETFHHGYLIQGMGPTDAWQRAHGLNVIDKGCSTQTTGPVPNEVMARIDVSLRYRKLTKQEAENLGK